VFWAYGGIVVDFLIAVNGIPGAGKTALASPLARALGVPLVGKDAIKEALGDAIAANLPTSQVGALAAENLWAIAGMFDGTVMVESFWSTGRDEQYFRDGLASLGGPPGVEIWCEVPVAVARSRFRSRERHAVHSDRDRREEWELFAARSAPISGLPVISVQTDREVDIDALAAAIRARQALPAL